MAMIRMGRLPLLFGGLLLYLLGAFTAVTAGHPFSPFMLLVGYAVLGPGHLSVHFSNDYFDAEGDRLGRPTGVSGGSGVLARYPDLRPLARLAALSLIGISCIAGTAAYLTVLPTPFLPILLVVGNGLGWFYSAPPVRLSSRRLGEASTAVTFGVLLPGMGFLAIAGGLDLTFLLASLPLTLLGIAFILSVEMPDREADALSGKRTFIVRYGVRPALGLILGASLLATLLYATGLLTGLLPRAFPAPVLAAASLVPLSFALLARFREPQGEAALVSFARRIVSSLIIFAALGDLCLLFVIFGP